jgi:hypothetical protein
MTALSCFLALLFATATVPQKPAGTHVIASSKDWAITAKNFEDIVASFPAEGRQRFSIPANRRNLLNELIRIWVLTTEAINKGIAVGPQYQARRDYYMEYGRQIGARITEEAVETFYKNHPDEFTKVRIAHILVLNGDSPVVPYADVKNRLPYAEARKKIEEVHGKLKSGGNFEQLAKEYSEDRDNAQRGGDIGYVSKGQIDRTMEAAAFTLKPGEFSDIIGSLFGFHILKVVERNVTPLNEARAQIRQNLMSDEVNRELEPKVKAAGVTIDESYFKP